MVWAFEFHSTAALAYYPYTLGGTALIEYCLAVPANRYEFDFKAHHQATRKGE
jgi:uncharacterized protein (DUF486 family)